jgi:endonuclease-3
MVVNLLARLGEIELEPDDYAATDVKPDVHIRRVFERLGFCGKGPTEQDAVEAARRLHPEYPGQIDKPTWNIGRTWCHASEPACTQCPLGDVCPKLV